MLAGAVKKSVLSKKAITSSIPSLFVLNNKSIKLEEQLENQEDNKMEKNNINQIKADIIIYIDDSDGNAEKKLKEFFSQSFWYNMTESDCIFLFNVTKSSETEKLCRYYEKKYPNIKIWE